MKSRYFANDAPKLITDGTSKRYACFNSIGIAVGFEAEEDL